MKAEPVNFANYVKVSVHKKTCVGCDFSINYICIKQPYTTKYCFDVGMIYKQAVKNRSSDQESSQRMGL